MHDARLFTVLLRSLCLDSVLQGCLEETGRREEVAKECRAFVDSSVGIEGVACKCRAVTHDSLHVETAQCS